MTTPVHEYDNIDIDDIQFSSRSGSDCPSIDISGVIPANFAEVPSPPKLPQATPDDAPPAQVGNTQLTTTGYDHDGQKAQTAVETDYESDLAFLQPLVQAVHGCTQPGHTEPGHYGDGQQVQSVVQTNFEPQQVQNAVAYYNAHQSAPHATGANTQQFGAGYGYIQQAQPAPVHDQDGQQAQPASRKRKADLNNLIHPDPPADIQPFSSHATGANTQQFRAGYGYIQQAQPAPVHDQDGQQVQPASWKRRRGLNDLIHLDPPADSQPSSLHATGANTQQFGAGYGYIQQAQPAPVHDQDGQQVQPASRKRRRGSNDLIQPDPPADSQPSSSHAPRFIGSLSTSWMRRRPAPRRPANSLNPVEPLYRNNLGDPGPSTTASQPTPGAAYPANPPYPPLGPDFGSTSLPPWHNGSQDAQRPLIHQSQNAAQYPQPAGLPGHDPSFPDHSAGWHLERSALSSHLQRQVDRAVPYVPPRIIVLDPEKGKKKSDEGDRPKPGPQHVPKGFWGDDCGPQHVPRGYWETGFEPKSLRYIANGAVLCARDNPSNISALASATHYILMTYQSEQNRIMRRLGLKNNPKFPFDTWNNLQKIVSQVFLGHVRGLYYMGAYTDPYGVEPRDFVIFKDRSRDCPEPRAIEVILGWGGNEGTSIPLQAIWQPARKDFCHGVKALLKATVMPWELQLQVPHVGPTRTENPAGEECWWRRDLRDGEGGPVEMLATDVPEYSWYYRRVSHVRFPNWYRLIPYVRPLSTTGLPEEYPKEKPRKVVKKDDPEEPNQQDRVKKRKVAKKDEPEELNQQDRAKKRKVARKAGPSEPARKKKPTS